MYHDTYHGIVICDRGFANECASEIKELVVARNVVCSESYITFDVSERADLLHLCYRMQTAVKVLELLGTSKLNVQTLLADCERFISQPDVLLPWVNAGRTFKIVTRFDEAEMGLATLDVAARVGAMVLARHPECKVNMKTPQTVICVYVIGETLLVGIDYSHENLSKREYKIFLNSTAIRSTVAAAMVRAAYFSSKKTLLDPFCGSGTIPIEAGLFVMHKSPMHFKKEYLPIASYPFFSESETVAFLEGLDSRSDDIDSLPVRIFGYDITIKNVDFSKKNAKIADVLSAVHFSRVEVDWIDIKLPQNGIDCIVSAPPLYRDAVDAESVNKVYRQLFHRAKEILTSDGVIVLLVNQPSTVKSLIPAELFTCVETRPVWMGQSSLFLLKIERTK